MTEKTASWWNLSYAPLYTFMLCKGTALTSFVQRRTLIQYTLTSDQKEIRRICLCRIQKQQGRQYVYDEIWRRVRKIFVPPSAIPKIWHRINRRQPFGPLVPPASTLRTKFHVKWPIFFQIVIKFRFSRKFPISNVMEIRPVRGALWHADGRTDRRTYFKKVTGSFDDCVKARKTEMEVMHMHSFLEMLCQTRMDANGNEIFIEEPGIQNLFLELEGKRLK